MTETHDMSPTGDGPGAFTDPRRAKSALSEIRRMADLLDQLYAGKIKREHSMNSWIHEKASRLAEAATALADSEFPPVPERSTGTWISPGNTPWIRDTAVCPFCGSPKLRLQSGDNQRIDAYCDSAGCDARDLLVLVLKDGPDGRADMRSDVQRIQGTR